MNIILLNISKKREMLILFYTTLPNDSIDHKNEFDLDIFNFGSWFKEVNQNLQIILHSSFII